MSSTGCNPAASCCGGSTPPVRTSAVRERRNACLRRRVIHNDLLGRARRRSDQRSPSAMCQRGDCRALPNVARRRSRGAARSARSSRRCVPGTRRPTPNRGRACSGTHADRSGGAGIRLRLARLGRRTGAARVRCGPCTHFWGRSSGGRAPRLHRGGAGSTPAVSTRASVVSTASTRPLYGRGAGSIPAGGSFLRL